MYLVLLWRVEENTPGRSGKKRFFSHDASSSEAGMQFVMPFVYRNSSLTCSVQHAVLNIQSFSILPIPPLHLQGDICITHTPSCLSVNNCHKQLRVAKWAGCRQWCVTVQVPLLQSVSVWTGHLHSWTPCFAAFQTSSKIPPILLINRRNNSQELDQKVDKT